MLPRKRTSNLAEVPCHIFRKIWMIPLREYQRANLVISSRTADFIGNAIRDNASTHTIDTHAICFAWGQAKDMEDWYASISAPDGTVVHREIYGLTKIRV